ncbi:excinuclease ABC subunit UvrC [Waterburya agarophytonicola K14]|uniref:UvrABC system protein C n=1 Tax=Waterburya agarophytonicola KI4 TaxID=2874699 RepID=A0A964FJD9_9CYAN|nr:excinuclease ABC subunit UvrC [Waterburya agarophytonicola]MCC0178618.1 excinuclease ABC subunit UvrC [Waterburya agarophytonicola KI4]
MTALTENTPLLKQPERLETRLKEIPPEPGVYFMRSGNGDILYIGKSKKLRSRVRSYFRDSQKLSDRIAMMVRQVTEIEFIVTDTEAEALALEANLIKKHQPYYNVMLKDDKKYPYVCITWSEDYPRIFITRKRRATKKRDRYYGPYVDTSLLRYTLHTIKGVFPLRQRRKPLFKDRPCLNYDIGKCPGVCQSLVTPEDYKQIVNKVAMVFQGRTDELINTLQSQMEKAGERLDFEKAAQYRDRIKALYSLNADQKVSLPDDTVSRDAIALAADDKHCCIQLFQIRAGKLVGRLGFFADAGFGTPGAILQKVLEEHYSTVEAVEIPTEILVQHELPEGEILTQWLTKEKAKKVTLVNPQRQIKAELIEMVERNANYELERTQRVSDRNNTALQDLAAILDLPEVPKRIEGYDISHIQGSNAVASQVVFVDGVPAKQHYRHYKIKNPDVQIGHSDDFASMAEVIGRRFRRYKNPLLQSLSNEEMGVEKSHDFPDLVMIDGGKGQLSAVVKALQEMNLLDAVKVVSLAKKREEIFLPGESKPLDTDPEQPGVQLLRGVRDESHRFAVSFHRQQRLKSSRRSRLEEIPGLGFHRQKQLLAHFHSIDYIREADVQKLTEVSGIGEALAGEIYNYFHPNN